MAAWGVVVVTGVGTVELKPSSVDIEITLLVNEKEVTKQAEKLSMGHLGMYPRALMHKRGLSANSI